MSKPIKLTPQNIRMHVDVWATTHGGISYDKLLDYIKHGDDLGEPVSTAKLARAAKTSKNTMIRWLAVIKQGVRH